MSEISKVDIVSLENIAIGYVKKKEKFVVQQNINSKIRKGELIGLIGQNGIGKSTLLKTLTKEIPLLEGKVTLEGVSISELSSLEKARKLSVVMTEKLPDSLLTVYEIIALGRQPYTNWMDHLTAHDHKLIQKSMEVTEIVDLATKLHTELSDGQLQRVQIARAIAQDTPIIILDEPTAHLDLYHTHMLFHLLRKLCSEEGKTILVSTHELHIALELVDRLWVMTEDGFFQGSKKEIIDQNILNKLFNSDKIIFDATINNFKFLK